jgi:hypothetical protein
MGAMSVSGKGFCYSALSSAVYSLILIIMQAFLHHASSHTSDPMNAMRQAENVEHP